jgi:hypothetical protein
MLHVDPRMLSRLNDLEADLINRRRHALDAGWLGEIEGIDLTLRLLRENRPERCGCPTMSPSLGMPRFRVG